MDPEGCSAKCLPMVVPESGGKSLKVKALGRVCGARGAIARCCVTTSTLVSTSHQNRLWRRAREFLVSGPTFSFLLKTGRMADSRIGDFVGHGDASCEREGKGDCIGTNIGIISESPQATELRIA